MGGKGCAESCIKLGFQYGGTNELDLLGDDLSENVMTQFQSSSSAHLFLVHSVGDCCAIYNTCIFEV